MSYFISFSSAILFHGTGTQFFFFVSLSVTSIYSLLITGFPPWCTRYIHICADFGFDHHTFQARRFSFIRNFLKKVP